MVGENDGAGGFMRNPAGVLREYLFSVEQDLNWDWGRVSVGLELVTLIRTIESIPIIDDRSREDLISAIDTFLRDHDLDECYELYTRLSEWRRVRVQRAGPGGG